MRATTYVAKDVSGCSVSCLLNKVKVKASIRKICDNCKIIKRRGVVRVICVNPKHKQRQG